MKNGAQVSDPPVAPLISIIIPVYKVEPYLQRCVESVIHQTYFNLEIILVDDGSPDRCGQICDHYAKQDNRVRVIHQENQGVSSARNAGMDIMTGEYCFFVDSDDYIDLRSVAILLDRAESTQADLVIGNTVIALDNHKILSNPPFVRTQLSKEGFTQTPVKYEYLYDPGYGVPVWNKLYQNRFLQKHQLRFDEQLPFGEDMVFAVRCLARQPTIHLVNQYTYYYCANASSLSQSHKQKMVEQSALVLESIRSDLEPLHQIERNQDLLAFVAFGLVQQITRNIMIHSRKKYRDIRTAMIQFIQSEIVARAIEKIAKEPIFRKIPRKKWVMYARLLSFFYHHKLYSITSLILFLRFHNQKG